MKNLTNITFPEAEMQLLDKGLKYNPHRKPRNWIQTLAMQADTEIKQLPLKEQAYM
jgi:hypothetical protein